MGQQKRLLTYKQTDSTHSIIRQPTMHAAAPPPMAMRARRYQCIQLYSSTTYILNLVYTIRILVRLTIYTKFSTCIRTRRIYTAACMYPRRPGTCTRVVVKRKHADGRKWSSATACDATIYIAIAHVHNATSSKVTV